MTEQNDPALQFLLEEHMRTIDVQAELDRIIADVKAMRAGTIQDAAAAVKAGAAPGPVDIGGAIIPRTLEAEHDLTHLKIAVFEIRGHAVYEVVMKSPKARHLHPREIQDALKRGLGAAFEDHPCNGWRDEWLPLVWGLWVQDGFKNDSARPFFRQVVPKSLEAAFEAA